MRLNLPFKTVMLIAAAKRGLAHFRVSRIAHAARVSNSLVRLVTEDLPGVSPHARSEVWRVLGVAKELDGVWAAQLAHDYGAIIENQGGACVAVIRSGEKFPVRSDEFRSWLRWIARIEGNEIAPKDIDEAVAILTAEQGPSSLIARAR